MAKIRILCYHRFGDGYITYQSFEKQIEYLKKNFNIIDLQSCLDFLYGKRQLSPNSVLLTVDDGYQDFYNIAFPILKKYNAPATVFLTVDFIDKRIWLWHDLLNYGLKYTKRVDFTLNGKVFNLKNKIEKYKFKLYLDGICTSFNINQRDNFINFILRELDVTIPEYPTQDYAPLTWDQILEMSGFRISYGSHTLSHPILSKISLNEALREMKESKYRIEEVLQKEILAFCYPNGKEDDFNEMTKKMVRKCGYLSAMTMIYGMNNLKSDRYELRRIPVGNRSFVHFIHDVSGFGVLRKSFNLKKVLL